MNDSERLEWIAEHLSSLTVWPSGRLEIKYINEDGYEKTHNEPINEDGYESPVELLKKAVDKMAVK